MKSQRNDRPRHWPFSRELLHAAVVMLTVCVLAPTADAAWYRWDPAAGTGNWSTASDWHLGAEPTAADTPFLDNGKPVTITETGEVGLAVHVGYAWNSLDGTVVMESGDLTVGGGSGGLLVGSYANSSGTFIQKGGDVVCGTVGVGGSINSFGVYTQTAGNVDCAGLTIAGAGDPVTPSIGRYHLSGSGNIDMVGNAVVGNAGRGTFIQDGGTLDVGGILYVGRYSGSLGVYTQSGGQVDCPTLSVGDAASSTGTYHMTSGRVDVSSTVYIGYSGDATFVLGAGGTPSDAHIECEMAYVARTAAGTANCHLTGGTLAATNNMYVGYSGDATVMQDGGLLTVSNILYLGVGAGGSCVYTQSAGAVSAGRRTGVSSWGGGMTVASAAGSLATYYLSGGTVTGNYCNVGNNGTGRLVQAAGSFQARGYTYIGQGTTGVGTYELHGGTYIGRLLVGGSGVGTFTQTGGTNLVDSMVDADILEMGTNPGATGTYNLVGGTILATSTVSLVVGRSGTGTFNFGTTNATGTITEEGVGLGSLIVPQIDVSTASGVFRGWGTVGFSNWIFLSNRGKIIADGYGTDRDLDLSSMRADVQNDIDNTSDSGWYARDGGKLILPAKSVAGGVNYWGEEADLDLVNAVQLTLATPVSGSLSGALLATDRADVIPGTVPIGVWDFSGATFSSATLTFRYDDAQVGSLGITEGALKVFHHTAGGWEDVTASINTTANTITTKAVTSLSQFAIGRWPLGTVVTVK